MPCNVWDQASLFLVKITVSLKTAVCCKLEYNLLYHQGALHVVLGEHKRSLVTKRTWEVMGKVWPALILAQHSEKPSIIRLIDGIADKLHKNMEGTELSIKVYITLYQIL